MCIRDRLRGARTEVVQALGSTLQVPANAEIVLEGHIAPDATHASGFRHALEGSDCGAGSGARLGVSLRTITTAPEVSSRREAKPLLRSRRCSAVSASGADCTPEVRAPRSLSLIHI